MKESKNDGERPNGTGRGRKECVRREEGRKWKFGDEPKEEKKYIR